MNVSTMMLLSNSTSLIPAAAATMSIVAPMTIPTTATTFTVPFIVTRTMHAVNKASKHHVKDFSPVTLSTEWSRMARLLILACLSVIGSIGNVFMISSVMIEDHLKKAGNAFIVSVALADLLVSSILIPTSVIVLLAGFDETSKEICRVQWLFAAIAFLVTILSLALTAVENYLRLCTPQDSPSWFNRSKTTRIILVVWLVAVITSGIQYTTNVGLDFCNCEWNGLAWYYIVIVALLIIIPVIITVYTHICIILDAKRFMKRPNFRRSIKYTWDLALVRTNFCSFIIFVMFWLPFGIVLSYNTIAGTRSCVNKRLFYTTAWIAFVKSCFHNVIYCITNRHFRNAYVNLFHYCCLKTDVADVAVSRRRRSELCTSPRSEPTHVKIFSAYSTQPRSDQDINRTHFSPHKPNRQRQLVSQSGLKYAPVSSCVAGSSTHE
ncbi:melatonin receptor type 1B-A-like isoform X1 [Contarinia nasturtii]|uniref:melatonin receptor type 1B-A-like isoform X1 n=1 Tax=Contarinia nasturtii TaxID=265458 RepID=UPI0012D3EF3C|nr:melatonin receptor type 1B-A-like isoform X1 [Contarinia nasturtii]